MSINKIYETFYQSYPQAEDESWSAVTAALEKLEQILTREQYMEVEPMITGIHTVTESEAFRCGFQAAGVCGAAALC